MPCNSVAVATAKISNNLTSYLNLMAPETISQAAQAYLKARFPNLALLSSQIRNGEIYLVAGAYTITINPKTGEVQVISQLTSRPMLAEIKQGIIDLLTGLAGLALQGEIVKQVASQARITGQQQAPNGAIVLSVEL